jgi:hypothetical protein
MPCILGLVIVITAGLLAVLVVPWAGRFHRATKRQYPNPERWLAFAAARPLAREASARANTSVPFSPDGVQCWMTSHDLAATGMPASSPTQREGSAWKEITFVCHMPRLSAEERQRLLAAWGDGHRGG